MENNKPQKKEYVLEVKNLKKYFPLNKNLFGTPSNYLKAVDDVTFSVEKGKTIGVVGESGCGKTTLGRTILRLYEADGGQIIFNGNDITNNFKETITIKSYVKSIKKASLFVNLL